MVAFDNSIFCLLLHPRAKLRTDVERAKDRVDFLLYTLIEKRERIVIPTPAFAEFLILAAEDGPVYIRTIRDNSIFRLEPFDERAAIELADMELKARARGNKRGGAVDSDWQKVKFDRQIVAIAKATGARCLYSDDPHIMKHGEECGLPILKLSDLPLPLAVQQPIEWPDDSPAQKKGSDTK